MIFKTSSPCGHRRRRKALTFEHPPPNRGVKRFRYAHSVSVERNSAILWTKIYTDSLIINKPPPRGCQFDLPDKKQKS